MDDGAARPQAAQERTLVRRGERQDQQDTAHLKLYNSGPESFKSGHYSGADAWAGAGGEVEVVPVSGAGLRLRRLRTASRSGAAAPERLISACASGQISGLSHGPVTTNGSSKVAAASRAGIRLAVPLRSTSRAGSDAEPISVSRTPGVSTRMSSIVAVPCAIFSVSVSVS